MRAQRTSVPAAALARWRDGIHIEGTPLWCDAYRARDLCFVSSADAVEPTRHGQVIATRETLALLSRSQRRHQPESELSVPVGRPFTLGSLRLELFATGHAVGSAGLWLTAGATRIAHAGTVCARGIGLGGSADTRAAEVLIIAAPYGLPSYRFPDPTVAARELVDLCREAAGPAVVVALVSSAVKGLDVACHLASEGLDVWAERRIHHAHRRLVRAGVALPAVRRAAPASLKAGRVVIWPAARRDRLPPLPPGSRIALVSGEAACPAAAERVGADVGIAWSNCADYSDLLAYIESTGAREIYLTGRHSVELAQQLDGDRRVRPLGPPTQLSLL